MATVKKPVVTAVKKPALTTKKTLAGKKTTIASKRGAAKKVIWMLMDHDAANCLIRL